MGWHIPELDYTYARIFSLGYRVFCRLLRHDAMNLSPLHLTNAQQSFF